VNVCLGTDSLASVYKPRRQSVELNLFEEMRMLARNEPSLSARTIVRMATLHGARALGMAGQIGEVAAGCYADLIALPLSGEVADIYDSVLHHAGNVAASMIDGQWAIEPR
jgi:5-methylthioadenosine/S-adenosylhomocysteine deaminase